MSVLIISNNLCVECGVDMGDQNPRQLCGKTYCKGLGDDSDDELVDLEIEKGVVEPKQKKPRCRYQYNENHPCRHGFTGKDEGGCRFIHVNIKKCKFYETEEGCHNGDDCPFAHIKSPCIQCHQIDCPYKNDPATGCEDYTGFIPHWSHLVSCDVCGEIHLPHELCDCDN